MIRRAINGANRHGFGASSISICRGPGAEFFDDVEDVAELRLVARLALICALNSDIVKVFRVSGAKKAGMDEIPANEFHNQMNFTIK
jgi:hypothetical protein